VRSYVRPDSPRTCARHNRMLYCVALSTITDLVIMSLIRTTTKREELCGFSTWITELHWIALYAEYDRVRWFLMLNRHQDRHRNYDPTVTPTRTRPGREAVGYARRRREQMSVTAVRARGYSSMVRVLDLSRSAYL